jgi:hypothetical protein
VDADQPVHAVPAEAMRVSLCLRDEEATADTVLTTGVDVHVADSGL